MKNKKVGILTLGLGPNYGNLLQAYALHKALSNLGYNVVLIDKRQKLNFYWISLRPILVKIKRLLTLSFTPQQVVSNLKKIPDIKKKFQKNVVSIDLGLLTSEMMAFPNNHLTPKTETFYTKKELVEICNFEKFDAIVVGSDQVWRYDYAMNDLEHYFLCFTENLESKPKRLTYAASFGTSDFTIPRHLRTKIRGTIRLFDGISVREKSGIKISKERLNVKAESHLDPTLLLDREEYSKLTKNLPDISKNSFILSYILDMDSDKSSWLTNVTNHLDKELVIVRDKGYFIENPTQLKQPQIPVEQWLKHFMQADYILTDSFHGTVFSILFNKPFVAVGNKNRGLTRFESLLKTFNLEDRLIKDINQFDRSILDSEINWDKVNKVLISERNRSSEYLLGTIG